jgi:cytochrome c553
LPKPGRTEAEPLVRPYTGLARAARCQPEVLTIMADVSAALGVGCDYCHAPRDYRVATPRKDIANWMAVELAPRLAAKTSSAAVGCADCHARDGTPRAKILGTPRSETQAIEWMTTELVENFNTRDGRPLRCKTCHGANLGSREFRRRLLLSDALAALPLQGTP